MHVQIDAEGDPARHAGFTALKATVRGITLRYVFALSLIAAMAVGGFLVLDATIESQKASSSIIAASAGQSARIREAVSIARELVERPDVGVRAARRAELFETVHEIETTHERLTDAKDPLGRPIVGSPAVHAIYFGAPLKLDRAINGFIAEAYRLAGADPEALVADSPTVDGLVTASTFILMSLDRLVDRLSLEAQDRVERNRLLESGILLATVLMLTIEVLFIFRPIVRRVWEEGSRLIHSQEQLVELAHYDPLTRLPNRTLFRERLEMALARSDRDGSLTAVLQLDLDHFKDVNDTLGHPAGDHLLREVSDRLLALLRGTDTVARIGGDEFAIILGGINSPHDAGAMARRILAALERPVTWQEHEIHTGTSIGITLHPADDIDPAQLLQNADIALYQAKSAGRNGFAFFVGEMKERVEQRARVERDLRLGLTGDEFRLLYQPQIRFQDGAVIGLEAFLRWHHPRHSVVRPSVFLTIAEETGLIVPLGLAVLRRALAQMEAWHESGIAPRMLSINVSATQLRAPRFVEEVEAALEEAGTDPRCLEFEITEGVILDRGHEKMADVIGRLRGIGISIALDDFGTGYASLAHLKRVRVDRLKIDRSFVRDLAHDPEDAAIACAVLGLGRALGLEVVAEGVEQRQQVDFLKARSCDVAQGEFFMAPSPAEVIETVLRQRRLAGPSTPLHLAAG